MASSETPILLPDLDIDQQIIDFCKENPSLTEEQVLRDIARIVCIVNLARTGALDKTHRVLSGGMAMRCLDSPRMSTYDGDSASTTKTNIPDMTRALSYLDDDIEIAAGPWETGVDLVTFVPVTFDARFSRLPGAQQEFSFSISERGLEEEGILRTLNHRYPFPLLADEGIEVPIMHPDEILAEKTVAWWLFGHAKHYNDIAFLAYRLHRDGRSDENPETRERIKRIVQRKLDGNRKVSERLQKLVDQLTPERQHELLVDPRTHLDPKHTFKTLSYLTGSPPAPEKLAQLVRAYLAPILFD